MQQPTSREMQGLTQQHYENTTANDDFLDQMLSNLPSWPELSSQGSTKSPWDMSNAAGDESVLLASRLRQHQISGSGNGGSGTAKSPIGLQQLMLSPMSRSAVVDSGLMPLPLSLGSCGGGGGGDSADVDGSNAFKSPNQSSGDGFYNGFGGSLPRVAGQQPFSHPQGGQSFGGQPAGIGQVQSASAGSGGGGGAAAAAAATGTGTAPPRQRVRARRGQATDPHSIAERLRRERIAERMKALQELVPNANKTDKASMLDEIIDYVKFLQLQVKVLSMSRLGGAGAVAPLVADMSSDGGRGGAPAGSGDNSLTVTEHQVAKLMEEDMGSAMQYLQGKGLCLMPISLASAISTATGHPRTTPSPSVAAAAGVHHHHHPDGPASPSLSVLTVQSAMAAGEGDGSRPAAKDNASISKS